VFDECEHRRRCANAERQRRDRERGESGRATRLSECVSNVADERSHPIALPHRGLLLAGGRVKLSARRVEVPEAAQCLVARGVGRPSGANEIGDAHGEVTLDLEIHLGVGASAAAESEVEQSSVRARRYHAWCLAMLYAVRLASDKIDVTDAV
jgi:hypothetical protein